MASSMKLSDIRKCLEAEILGETQRLDREILFGGASDLMSDVLAFVSKDDTVLLSGLINEQVVRTAHMVDVPAIVFVRGKRPAEGVVRLADENGIVLMTTRYTMYVACGKLYEAGLGGFDIDDRHEDAGE